MFGHLYGSDTRMKHLRCKFCGSDGSLVVRYTEVEPASRQGWRRFYKLGLSGPFIFRIRVCRVCGAQVRSVESLINWSEGDDNNQTSDA